MGEIANYVKIHEAVQAFCEWSLPSIQACIEQWHQSKQQILKSCQKPTTCPSHKKPSTKGKSCQHCIDWGHAVDAVRHLPGLDINWRNMNVPLLHKDPVEIAKGFVFIIPHGQTCASFTDFDIGGILKMMMGFKVYHQGDQTCLDKIKKVVEIRNKLSHMKLKEKMEIPDVDMNNDFHNINDLVTDLESRHQCLKADTIKNLLNKIQLSDVTDDRIQRAMRLLTDGLQQALELVLLEQTHVMMEALQQQIKDLECSRDKALQQQTEDLQSIIEGNLQDLKDLKLLTKDGNASAVVLQQRIEDLQCCFTELKKMVPEALQQLNRGLQHGIGGLTQTIEDGNQDMKQFIQKEVVSILQSKGEDEFDVEAVRRQLISEYRQTRSQIQLLPGIPEECACIEDIYVDLELCEQQSKICRVQARKVKASTAQVTRQSYSDIFDVYDNQGSKMKHILVTGNPGCGKSTLISKIAYDWAKNKDPQSVHAQFQLVFAIDLKEVPEGADLFDAIQDQLLPNVSSKDLKKYVEHHAESVLFLFDGYDEIPSTFLDVCKDFKHVLSGKLFPDSFVIMTSRSHKVAEVTRKYKTHFAHVVIHGLPKTGIVTYVSQFFQVCLEYIDWFNRPIGIMSSMSGKMVEPPVHQRKDAERVASLIAQILTNEHLYQICRYPMILTMVCFLWDEDQDFSLILTRLYQEAVVHIAKNRYKENSDGEFDVQRIRSQVDSLLLKIGKVALEGLLENKLLFTAHDFDLTTLNDACEVGLVLKERKRSKLNPVIHVTFIHKTFQEMAAAYYWASLAGSNVTMFHSYHMKIDALEDNEILLRFCCGVSSRAAELILPGVVEKSCILRDNIKESNRERCFLGHYYKEFDPWRLPLFLIFEVDNNTDESRQLHSLLRPLVSKLEMEANCFESVGELWSVLRSLSEKAQSAPDCSSWFQLVDEVYIADKCGGKGSSIMGRSQFLKSDPAVAVAVPCMSNLTSLVIDGSPLQNCSCLLQNLATSSKASTSLNQLVCREYDFESTAMASFLSRQKHLSILEIKGSGSNEERYPQEARQMVEAVTKATRTMPLEVLILDEFPLNQYVYSLKPLILHLKELQISRVYVNGTNSCKDILEMISSLSRKLPLVKLSLQDSNKDDAGKSLAEAVKYLPDLKCLNLWHGFNKKEPGLKEDDFKVCGPAMKDLHNLTELELCGNTIGNSMKELGQGLQHLKNLQVLLLHYTKLTGDSAGYLPFEHLPDLKKLQLGSNKFGEGISELSEKLKYLTNLKEFEFSCANLTDEQVALLPLSYFKRLTSLDLGFNSLWSEGLCTVAKQLKHMPKLQILRLGEQQQSVSDEVVRGIRLATGVETVLRNVKYVPNLKTLFVPDIYVSRNKSEFLTRCINSRVMQNIKDIKYDGQHFMKLSGFIDQPKLLAQLG